MSRQFVSKLPEVRFQGFDQEWQEKHIGEVLSETKRSIVLNDDHRYELITVKRRNGGVVSRGHLYGREILVKNYSKVAPRDFLISKRQVVHGATGIVPKALDGAIVSNEYLVAVGNIFITSEFLMLVARQPPMYRKFFLSSYGVDVEKLFFDVEDWKTRTIIIPQPDEQSQISSYFKSLDRMIELHQQKHNKLVTLKQAMLQKMFPQDGATTPEIRFKGYLGEWEEKELGEIYSKIRNAFVGTATPYYTSKGHFYLQSNNVKDGAVNRNTEVFVNEEFHQKQKNNWLQTDDIVMVQSGHVGHTAVIEMELHNSAAHALIIISQPSTSTCSRFVNVFFQTSLAKKSIANITTGNTIKHILASDIKQFKVSFPEYEEQQKIGTYFRNLDKLISKHTTQLEKLKNIKSACLEKMFV